MGETRRAFGQWWEPGSDDPPLAGELTWQPPGHPELLIVNAPMKTGLALMAEEGAIKVHGLGRGPVSLLHGLVRGGPVTLLGLSWQGMSMGGVPSVTIRATAALFGVHLANADEPWFRRARISLPELPGLIGEWPLSKTLTPRGRRRKLEVTVTKRKRSWTENGLTLTWKYDYLASYNPMHAKLQAEPVAIFEGGQPRSLEGWLELIRPQTRLLAISTGLPARPRSITLWEKQRPAKAERPTADIEVWGPVLDPDVPEVSQTLRLGLMSASDVDKNPRGLHGVLDAMIELADEQELFLSLLENVIYLTDRPATNLFLDAVIALEAFDGKRRGKGPIGETEFKDQRKAVWEAVKAAEVPQPHRKFIKDWLCGESLYPLHKRLQALLKMVPDVQWAVPSERVARLRNEIAHGNDKVDVGQLGTCLEQALLLGRKLVAHELQKAAAPPID